MARKKCKVTWSGAGWTGPEGYVYFEEDEINAFKSNMNFRNSLIEKYFPKYQGRVISSRVFGSIENA